MDGAPQAPAGAFVDAAQSVALFSVTNTRCAAAASSSMPMAVSAAAVVTHGLRCAQGLGNAASRLRQLRTIPGTNAASAHLRSTASPSSQRCLKTESRPNTTAQRQ